MAEHLCYAYINKEGVEIKYKVTKLLLIVPVILILALSAFAFTHSKIAHAADNDVSNGITVDSKLDTPDANVGDNICDDGDGNCTLRAAIEEANSNADATNITFNISGAADFTNGGQNGYTIQVSGTSLYINSLVHIDGYSQPGSQQNTAVSPSPFNGKLLIEIDGSGLEVNPNNYMSCLLLDGTATATSSITGLVVNRCGDDGIAVQETSNVSVTGNYIGTDYTGVIDRGNNGSGVIVRASDHVQIGGTDAADRNVIAGNTYNDLFITNENNSEHASSDNVIEGNYFGLGADGLTPLPAGFTGGLGNAVLIGNSANDRVGGTASGAKNVVGSSLEMGVSFRAGASGGIVQGNYIGTDYTGNASPGYTLYGVTGTGNASSGIHIGTVSNVPGFTEPVHDITVGGSAAGAGNVIAGNTTDDPGVTTPGLYIHDGSYNNSVKGNHIGVGADGTTALGNSGYGVGVLQESDSFPVYSNIIGGTTAAEANIIANNRDSGIIINGNSANNSILRNSIYDNGGFGIDLGSNGTTPNDALDADSGPNNLLNFPKDVTYEVSGSDTVMRYNLDVPAGNYRVEFFSNTAVDGSGYGEGETFIGSQNVTSSGAGSQEYSATLTGSSHTNISATATRIDGNQTFDFGETSEFSATATAYEPPPPVSDISLTKTLTNPNDIAVGAMANYHLSYTNNGPDDADLSGYTLGGNPFLYDYVPGEDLINAANYVSDGPFPGTYFIDVNNPQVVCLYGGAPGASFLGLTTDTSIGVVACWLAGGDTTLGSGQSLSFDVSFEVAPESDLQFTNYAFGMPATGDPDWAAINEAATSGDTFAALKNMENPPNNFAAAPYPVPVDPDPDNGGGQNSGGGNNTSGGGPLASTGASTLILVGMASLLVLSSGAVLSRRFR